MKNQALFSMKDKSKKFKCRLLQFLFGALRVKHEKADNKTYIVKFKKNALPNICSEFKDYWAHSVDLDEVTSSGSTLFANSAIFVIF